MSKKEFIYVPISVEYLMSALFGKLNYHAYVGGVGRATWKKDLRKVAKYIKKSIELNPNTDAHHKSELLQTCDRLEKKVKEASTIDQINVATIEKLIRVVFLLLGNMPDHWRRRSPYADRFWELDGHRTLGYTQTDEQKAYLIINLVDIGKRYDIRVKGYEDLHDVFYRRFKGKASEFLGWFKKSYPETYCQIF